jgi:hypothetical protein
MRTRALPVLILLPACHAWADDLRAGASAVKITPPRGIAMYGYYHNRGAAGVHDDLYAKAIVFENDGMKAALVSCDLGAVPRAMVEEARALIAQRTGIPGERVMIGATHTHTGPVLLDRASRYNLTGEMLEITKRYSSELPSRIADSVKQALDVLGPVKVFVGRGHEESLVFNRRFFMTDGSVGWNPGKLNPKIVKPAGPVDPEVAVVYLERPDGKPLATYVNYALHLDTVGGDEFSADYPYTLSTILGKVKGPEMVTVFAQGCSGNVNHLDVKSASPQKGHGEAARIGTVLAGEVLKTCTRLEPASDGLIGARSEIVKLPLPRFDPGEVAPARATASKFGEPGAAPFLELVQAFKVIDVAEREGKPVEAEVQVITVGGQLAFVALPGEVFVELGQAIKASSPFPITVVVELANGSIGYVPNRKAYPEGNYEVVSSRVAEGSGEMLVEAALRLLREVRERVR